MKREKRIREPSMVRKESTPRPVALRDARAFHRAIVAAMVPLNDQHLALGMRAYMRDQFPYLGIPTPLRRKTAMILVRRFEPPGAEDLRSAAISLWKLREREYQYIAVDLLNYRHAHLGVSDLPWLLKLAQEKPWWDTIDGLAKVVSRIVRRELTKGQLAMDRAVKARSFWVRRIAMLHQLGWRSQTDTTRLFAYADALAQEEQFFIRKAIGWALRDYAWHDPVAVRQYLQQAGERLSKLTCREAGKHCMPSA
jgi:3-methyladenine DNA glycosylase AlkD